MPARNLPAEQNALRTFIQMKGRVPQKGSPTYSQDFADIHKIAYPTINDLPDEFRNTEAASYYTGTNSSPTPAPTPGTVTPPAQPAKPGLPQDASAIQGLRQNVDTARANLDQLSSPNSALNVLQEAIKAKTGAAKASIGESEIFKQAGVGGFGALAQSLNARGTELNINATDFRNIVNTMSGTYKDMATAAQFRYQAAADAYKEEVSRIQKVMDDLRDNEQQIKLLELQHRMAKDLESFRSSTPSASDRLNAYEHGLVFDASGNLVTPEPTSVEADALADAIAQHESGGKFGLSGASGESGAFQFMPGTWNIISKQYAQANGVNTSLAMTPENEDKVARWKIAQLLASGKTPREVALIWNGSLGGSEEPVVKSGVNSKGVKYDTGTYADSVMNILKQKTSPTNSEAQMTAQSIFDGTSNLKVSDLPTAKRTAVNNELVKLKNAALKSGDITGIIRASAGGKEVDTTVLQSMEKTSTVLGQVQDLKNEISKEDTGPILGILRSANPYDKKAQLIKAELASIVPGLARGVYGEVGVLTDQDIENYSKTLPNLKSTEEVRNAVLQMTIKSLLRSFESKLKIQAGGGRDVSGFATAYQEMKQLADGMSGGSSSPVSVQAPNGKTYTFDSQEQADAWKKTVGL